MLIDVLQRRQSLLWFLWCSCVVHHLFMTQKTRFVPVCYIPSEQWKKAPNWLLDSFVTLGFFLKCLGVLYTNELETCLKCLIQLCVLVWTSSQAASIYISFLCSVTSWTYIFGSLILNVLSIYWTSPLIGLQKKHSAQNCSGTASLVVDQRGDMTLFQWPGASLWLCEGCVPLYSFQMEVLTFPGIGGPSMNHCFKFISICEQCHVQKGETGFL